MNVTHMKYAVEIAEAGSISKASETLYVSQPNISRAVKELETSLGITIFDRSTKGMELTPNGEEFISYAKNILKQLNDMETLFHNKNTTKKRFSISVPRASYVADAFVQFSSLLSSIEQVDVFYQETNALQVIKNILYKDYKLGIIRYASYYTHYYKSMIEEKGLTSQLVANFHYVLLMNRLSPLAQKQKITFDDLSSYIEIAHADPYVPSLSLSEIKKRELPDNVLKRIFVFERASQLELLAKNPDCFMWVSPIPEELLSRYSLIQRTCEENKQIYKDMLIYRKEYHLTELDQLFIAQLQESKKRTIPCYINLDNTAIKKK